MRKQHHYTNEQQIIEKIDDRRERAREFNATSELMEERSKGLLIEAFNLANSAKTQKDWESARSKKAEGYACKDEAVKARKRAKRIEEVVLPALGETLAEFRTAPMIPVVGDNHSVASLV